MGQHEQDHARKLAELRALIAKGDKAFGEGRYKVYGPGELAAEIRASRALRSPPSARAITAISRFTCHGPVRASCNAISTRGPSFARSV